MGKKDLYIILLFIISQIQIVLSQNTDSYLNNSIDTLGLKSAEDIIKTDNFFDTLKIKAYNNRWTKELHNIIILPPQKSDIDTLKTEQSILNYISSAEKIIQNIDFIRLDPFGTTLWDTSYENASFLCQIGNAAHFKTLESVIRRHLIVKIGDKLDPHTLADTERILRELKYIDDVRIIINEDTTDPDYVNLIILTKDVWSKAFFVELKDIDAGKLALWDRNLFGMGNSFEKNIHWNPSKSDFWGYDAVYESKNILGSFINSEVFYRNVFETEAYGIKLERKFLTPNTKYAGGFRLLKTQTTKNIWYSDSLQLKHELNFSNWDSWLGRSFLLSRSNGLDRKRLNLILASRILQCNYTKRPDEVSDRLFYEYHSKLLWINSISLTAQRYYRSNLIYSFGRTEDIPAGWMANLSFGKEFSEFRDRYYTSLNLSHGGYIGNVGYLYTSSAFGGFITRDKDIEQGVLDIKLNYFTNLFVLGRYKFRYFVNISYLKGINRFDLERININDSRGITGLSSGSIYGQQRASFNIEGVLFSPATLYGFKFTFFGFNDFALVGNEISSFLNLDSYSGYGLGIRIRNEKLVFPTLQFRISFYPGIKISPEDHLRFSGEKKLNPNDFRPSAPNIINFY